MSSGVGGQSQPAGQQPQHGRSPEWPPSTCVRNTVSSLAFPYMRPQPAYQIDPVGSPVATFYMHVHTPPFNTFCSRPIELSSHCSAQQGSTSVCVLTAIILCVRQQADRIDPTLASVPSFYMSLYAAVRRDR